MRSIQHSSTQTARVLDMYWHSRRSGVAAQSFSSCIDSFAVYLIGDVVCVEAAAGGSEQQQAAASQAGACSATKGGRA